MALCHDAYSIKKSRDVEQDTFGGSLFVIAELFSGAGFAWKHRADYYRRSRFNFRWHGKCVYIYVIMKTCKLDFLFNCCTYIIVLIATYNFLNYTLRSYTLIKERKNYEIKIASIVSLRQINQDISLWRHPRLYLILNF